MCEGHLVYGSINKGSVDSYFYDPATDSWSKVADMPGKGVVAGACFALGNKVYAGAGIEEPIEIFHNEFYEYDVAKDTWSPIANYPGTGTFSPVTFVIDNDGYVVTGASKTADTKNCYRLRLSTVGIDEVNHPVQLEIYPNVSATTITVLAQPNERVSVFSADGRLVQSYIQQTKQADLNIESYASGLYLIQAGNSVKKFVRE
jgi:N-acetylneuraminic acid mutarotase